MLIQAPIPRTRFAITPTNVRPIHVCLDMTPTRQFSNHNSILNLTQRLDDRLPIRAVVENKHPQSIIVNRVHGNSFSQNQSNKEIQNQIQELTKQRENMAQILSEAIRKNNLLQKQLDKLQSDKTEQALQFQVNLDQFQDQITQLTSRLEDLIIENTQLQESYQSQQFYIEQLEYQENDQLNITQHFGQM
ncbi:unnamed protein product (macronuclear) [Paramecium tetraurelia]|uniref:Uncharacterized protein n=1 Tax=Paramecium tetraurelia TaxID=5888 RepID=A0BGG6_PARTE|nr:uncharacterized protein GSPATT00028668001 [Paramecium tetraurelia]CAK57633.1 unnamed protein product [Paramecium tetraurelia]|eukprot:XP_001425031.1 hypothetical protein (macronuclear) [Paramecium tetraurelia strain d4-2]